MKSVVVTGAYGGMGKATVKKLQANGFRVFALDINIGYAEDNIIPIQTDLTSEDSVKTAFNVIKCHTDSIYAIIHFSGIYMLNSLVEMDSVRFKRILDINLNAAFIVNKTFLPLLEKGSRILITTSELAPLAPLPFTGIYAVSKAALDKYAYSLRMELQLLGIDVSVLRAGAVETKMLDSSTSELDNFCEQTKLYSCNANRFKRIVNGVEARCISTERLASKVTKIIAKKRQKFAYSINRNPLLLLLNCMPQRLQFWIIKQVLK